MLRLIARIDARNGFHIKTINCEGVQKIRPIIESIEKFSNGDYAHDEIILIDSVASLYGFDNWLLRENTNHFYCPIPLSIGGGISNVEDATKTLHKGADKIVINTSAISKKKIITDFSKVCGRQAVILQVDAKEINNDYVCFTHGAREISKYKVRDWIRSAQDNGAGEIHLTSIDCEGTFKKFPLKLAEIASNCTNLPLIISGGIRSADQISNLNKNFGLSSFSFSSLTNICNLSLKELRNNLINLGHHIRIL